MRHWKKKLKKVQISGSTYLVNGWEELTSLKCPYYPKQSIDSTLSTTNDIFHRFRRNISKKSYGIINDLKEPQ